MFEVKTLSQNEFGTPFKACECKICGKKWVESCSNEHKPTCCLTAEIREWDGKTVVVGYRRGHKSSRMQPDGEQTVEIVYQDGLRQKISYDYLLDLMI